MMQKFKTFFLAAKTGTAKFLRAKGIYVVIMTLVACAGTAAALIFIPRGESEAPQPTDPGSEVNLSGDERLYVMKTPEVSPTPSPSPIPDFTQAPATAAPSAKPLWSPPVRGEIIWGYAVNELIYSRTLRHIRTSVLIQCWRFYFAHGSRQKALVARLSGGFFVFCRL